MSQQPTPPVNKNTGSYVEDADGDGIRMNAFGHEDADVAFDPLSANRRFPGTADLAVLGTLVFAGPTRESIDVMVPDCPLPPASGTVRVDLRHHVSLSLAPSGRHVELGTGDSAGESPVPYIPRQDARSPTTGLLGGTEPHIKEMEEREQWPLPGVCATDTGEYGPPSSTSPHHLCLLLEVPGTELLLVVHIRAQCKGPH